MSLRQHDFFIARSIDLLKNGVIAAFVIASGTMDKAEETAREHIAKSVNLVAAIRLSILLALLSGVAIGLFHALFIVYFRIPSLVVTLGSTSLMSGIVQWFTNSSTIGGIDNALIMAVVGGRLFGVPYAFYYALGAAIVMWYIFDFTPVGRRLLFVGRGREVARLNGIAVERVRVGALVMSSVVAAAAGVLYAGVLGSADPYSGLNYLLPAFAAAFLGSTTIMPGRFNPWGTIVAVYFLGTGITGLTMFGIPLWVTNVFNGGALILAVTISQLTRGREFLRFYPGLIHVAQHIA